MCINLFTSEDPQVTITSFTEHTRTDEFIEFLPEWMYKILEENWAAENPIFYFPIKETHYFYTDYFQICNKTLSLLMGIQDESSTYVISHKNPLFIGPELPPGNFTNFTIHSAVDTINNDGSCMKTDGEKRYNLKVKNKHGEFKFYGAYRLEEVANSENKMNLNFVSYDLNFFTRLVKKVKSDKELCELIVLKFGKDLNRKKARKLKDIRHPRARIVCDEDILPQMHIN